MNSERPIKRFRAGGVINVSVWDRPSIDPYGKEVGYRCVTIDKRYRDNAGEWKSTRLLGPNDIPKLVLLLNKAFEWMVFIDSE